MKFGLAFASSIGTDQHSALEICRMAEALGFESVWGGEHVIFPTTISSPYPYTADGKVPATGDTPIPDPLIWLAYVAAAAPSVRLGTCILILPQRNPLVLAKELATLDHLTGGRVELGIGVGWMREEFDALGVPWERRGARTDEYVAALRTVWSGRDVSFHGEFVDFEPLTCTPRPAQASIPVMVGGDSPAAIRRAARLGDGFYPGTGDLDELARMIAELHDAARAEGRDPADIEVSAMFVTHMGDPAAGVERLTEIGVGRAMVPAFFFAGPDGHERLADFAAAAGIEPRG